jgi:REP element-mobilizing transposase RayT/DNA-binding NarL/FixJ family response regulator
MAISILVATSNPGFGELVSQILLETGDYQLSIARSKTDILAALDKKNSEVLILETDLAGGPTDQIVSEARAKNPELLLLLIVSEEISSEILDSEISPDGMLSKPVYLPDLVSKVEEVIDKGELYTPGQTGPLVKIERHTGELSPPPQWLSDVNLAAQYLTSLTLESSAQASLITKLDQIWAYSGELPQPAAEELAIAVSQHFQNGGGSDLARFIRLEQTGSEYMLYATGLGGPFVLSTVFDAEMPFSKIRAQASNLAMALASPPPVEDEEVPQITDEEDEYLEEGPEMDLWPLLEDVPPPIPTDWEPELAEEKQESSLLDELMESTEPDEFSSETVAMAGAFFSPEEEASETPDLAITAESSPRKESVEAVTEETPARGEVDLDDLPLHEEQIEVEPVSPSMYNLTYACVLIPRFLDHHLTGDVAERLTDWITHLCVAFGWRLEQLSIRPEYIQWMVNVPPNTSPGYLMRTIREHTSRRMFVEFPTMEQDNPAGDFWAPGYLVLGTPQPPPAVLIQEFMENTRSRQGLQD